jgi:hypothetical protein
MRKVLFELSLKWPCREIAPLDRLSTFNAAGELYLYGVLRESELCQEGTSACFPRTVFWIRGASLCPRQAGRQSHELRTRITLQPY